MPLEIVRNDITRMKVDAIVNAANSELKAGGGVCGAIFNAAGADELQAACDEMGECPVGHAVITDAFNLPAKYIIHTPGPIWQGGSKNEANLLQSSYIKSLELASQHKCKSVAFPLISTGIYGYPKEEALQIALSTISSYLMDNEMVVYLVVFDKASFGVSKKLFASINQYIDEHYVDEMATTFSRARNNELYNAEPIEETDELELYEIEESLQVDSSLADIVNQLDESFSERLLRLIDERGLTDAQTYKRANIDRRLFSKIRKDAGYTPKKKTAIAFAIALQLDVDETIHLLSAAGYTLTHSSKFDVIIEFFIKQAKYNIHEINEALFMFDQPLLGA
ncbi:macro domain-containing protein [Fredinandcohnia onubensis]|uniref:macro domain-containing protein n=1 Tax=Fredinandcohnia onubensis TaxID=1571209 RepID=UPI000C0BED8D|nr:macro domain-containing protein [Fredinandcohnia onubensis]